MQPLGGAAAVVAHAHNASQYTSAAVATCSRTSGTRHPAHLHAARDGSGHGGRDDRVQRDAAPTAPPVRPQLSNLIPASLEAPRPLLHPAQHRVAVAAILLLQGRRQHVVLRAPHQQAPIIVVHEQQLAEVGAGPDDQKVARQPGVLRR